MTRPLWRVGDMFNPRAGCPPEREVNRRHGGALESWLSVSTLAKGETVLVADLQRVIEQRAPAFLSQAGDNSGLLVGDERSAVRRVLAALELTDPVSEEAVSGAYDTILTHHPFLFAPVRSLVESRSREALLRRLVMERMTLISCHTNLDAAAGGLADIAGEGLGLLDMEPLEPAPAGWLKLVGFVPREAVEAVAATVFAVGAGGIGNYRECAFAAEGTGWFTPDRGSNPTIGAESHPERTPEVRWETVVPRNRLGAAVRAFVSAHPYEEPALDVYPVEDILTRLGLGRVGRLAAPLSVEALAGLVRETFEVSDVSWCGDGGRMVSRVAVVPGSGRSLLEAAAEVCDVLVTGDLGYHEAERALERGLSLIDVPHGGFEWWAFKRWAGLLGAELASAGVRLTLSERWRPAWERIPGGACRDKDEQAEEPVVGRVRLWIDGGSRGNPGLSAIGVVVEDDQGRELETVGKVIGQATNNVAEYRALIVGLELARGLGAADVEVRSDSELLVRQMTGEYKVKNEGLKPLHGEARALAAGFDRFSIAHVERELNRRADALVNRALDEQERAGL